MGTEANDLREFGGFRLDVDKRVLWHSGLPVDLALKEIEILCVLTERGGDVVTKDELLDRVWQDSFVEESNLSRHIYVLRKMFKRYGESEDSIVTVPRRGYRFATDVRAAAAATEIVLERHTRTRSEIEILEGESEGSPAVGSRVAHIYGIAAAASVIVGICILAIWMFRDPVGVASASDIKSVAVLPVRSFSESPGDEELRLQITDALITRLGNLEKIAVRPTSAVLSFIAPDTDILEAGRRLRVDAVIDGRIQQENGSLRITLQLVKVATGEHVWSQQFDGRVGQILSLQDRISAAVAKNFDTSERDRNAIAQAATSNPDAYEAYLKGRYFWSKRDEASVRRAIEYFRQAIASDPQFSEAYTGLADSQYLLFDYNIEMRPQLVAEAKQSLRRALELKPESPDALTTLGTIQMGYEWDWASADESLSTAVRTAPNSPTARMRRGALLVRTRRFEEAQEEFKQAIDLDPLSTTANLNLGLALFCGKDYAAAERQYRKTMEIDDKIGAAYWLLSRALWQAGRKEESVREIVRALDLDRNPTLAQKVGAAAMNSTPEEAIKTLLFEWRDNPPGTNPHNLAYLSTYIGDREKAIYWLEKSIEEHHPWTTWLAAAPEFENLNDMPRYREMLTQLKLSN